MFLAVPHDATILKALTSSIAYAAFNLSLAQAVLVPIAVEMNDKQTVRLGGYIGGGLLTVVLISSHLILSTLLDFRLYDIPMAVIVGQVASGIFFIYLLVIYGEIFSTVIGNMYGLERQIKKYVRMESVWIYGGILVMIYVIGLIDYGTLLRFLYPIFGYVSILFLFIIMLKPFINKTAG
ncbi:hypothetical protein ACI2OX_14255 [Bacillus sp. N9]